MKLSRYLMWSALFWLAMDFGLTVFYGRVLTYPWMEGNPVIQLVIRQFGLGGLLILVFNEAGGIFLASRIFGMKYAWPLVSIYAHAWGAASWVLVMLNGGMGR